MEGFAEINKRLANQQQSINESRTDVNTLKFDVNQLKIDSKNTKDLLIDAIKTNNLKVSNSELIEHEDLGMEI